MPRFSALSFALSLSALACLAIAQSPNTATMIVVVVDQTGAVVKDAKVSVVNTATGAAREAVSGSDGSATIPALSLTGTYTVSVSKAGFGNEELKDITLRSGETATLKVKLLRRLREGGGHRLRHRRRRARGSADRPPARQPANRRDADPRPQGDDAAAAQFGVPPGEGHGRSLRQPDLLRHRRGFAPHDHGHARRREQR